MDDSSSSLAFSTSIHRHSMLLLLSDSCYFVKCALAPVLHYHFSTFNSGRGIVLFKLYNLYDSVVTGIGGYQHNYQFF